MERERDRERDRERQRETERVRETERHRERVTCFFEKSLERIPVLSTRLHCLERSGFFLKILVIMVKS